MVYTDLDGNFALKAGINDTLRFTYVSQPIDIPVSKMKKDEINQIVFEEK